MSENRRSEIGVDQLMQRIREEIERRKASHSRSSTATIQPAHAPAGSMEFHSLESVTAPVPLKLQIHNPESLNVQPMFKAEENGPHHVDDLLVYHDKTFIFAAYQTLLRRAPDQDGFRHYLKRLREGISKIEILGKIRNSAEGRAANVHVVGLTIPYAIEMACSWPIVGNIIRFGVAAWNLPQLLRRQRKIENQLYQFAELADQRTTAEIRHIHGALREIESSGTQQLSYSATRASQQALLALRGLVASIKADQSTLAEARQLIELALATKAERHEIATLNSQLTSLIQMKLARADIASLERSLDALGDTTELLSLTKADRADLKSVQRDIQFRFGEELDRQNQTVQALAHTKADHAAIENVRADVLMTLRTTQEELSRSMLSLAQTKVDHSALASLQAETKATLQSTLASLNDAMQSLVQTKADRSVLESVQSEAKTALQSAFESLNAGLQSLFQTKADIASVAVATAETNSALESIRRNANGALNTALEPLATQTQKLKRGLLDQERRLGALLKEARKRLPKPISNRQVETMLVEERHLLDSTYASFEDQFRGTREDIRQRQQVYLPYVRNVTAGAAKGPVIDLGCGRGEWLELLRDERIPARGVDLNRVFLDTCRQLKLNVTEWDAIEFLGSLKSNSVRTVTAFHLIEHLPFDALMALFDEALRVLRPGGLVIFETPNPRNMIVGSCTFYLDPTHRNPLPPELPRYLLENRGFENVTIKELHPFPKESLISDSASQISQILNQRFFGPQDYAVIATKGRR